MKEINYIKNIKKEYNKFKNRDLNFEDICGFVGGISVPIIGFEIILLWMPKAII